MCDYQPAQVTMCLASLSQDLGKAGDGRLVVQQVWGAVTPAVAFLTEAWLRVHRAGMPVRAV